MNQLKNNGKHTVSVKPIFRTYCFFNYCKEVQQIWNEVREKFTSHN